MFNLSNIHVPVDEKDLTSEQKEVLDSIKRFKAVVKKAETTLKNKEQEYVDLITNVKTHFTSTIEQLNTIIVEHNNQFQIEKENWNKEKNRNKALQDASLKLLNQGIENVTKESERLARLDLQDKMNLELGLQNLSEENKRILESRGYVKFVEKKPKPMK